MPGGLPDSLAPQGAFGKYLLLMELGRGGMGVVYEAIDTELNRPVALKMLLPTLSATPEEAAQDQERFIREARLCANLPKHPHIVGVYEAGVIDGRRYIAMEYVKGRQMSAWAKSPTVSLRQRLAVLRDVSQAVHLAHRHGVIHRDLKPDNVLIDDAGVPHVMDFGLAKRMTESTANAGLTVQGLIVGTPVYMSPEQAEGRREVDARTDVYALGVMLFEIVAGRAPFQGPSPIQVLMKVIQEPVPSPTKVAESKGLPPVDPALERVSHKALAKQAAERYPTAGEFAEELTRWLDGRDVAAAAPKRTARKVAGSRAASGKSGASNRGLWIGAAVAAVVLLAVGGVLLFRDEAPRTAAIDYGSAEAHLAQGRAEEALRGFESILRAHPGDGRAESGARKARGRIVDRLLEEAERQLAEGQLPEALVAFTRVLDREPENVRAVQGQKEAKRRIETDKKAPVQAAVNPAKAEPREIERPAPPLPPKPPEDKPALPAVPRIPPAAVEEQALAPGLIGEYFADRELGRPALNRIDPAIDFRWGTSPAWAGGPTESYSVRWKGYLRVPKAGVYLLRVTSNDGMRMFLGDTPVIANWSDHLETVDEARWTLDAGYYPIRMEYYQAVAQSVIVLAWSESAAPAQPIPASLFFHARAEIPPPVPVELAGPQKVWGMLLAGKDKLRGQTVVLPKPGMADATAVVREMGEKEILLTVNVAGGGTLESRETPESIAPATLLALARRVWPKPTPEQLKLLCGVVVDRGDFESAWKELERARTAGVDPREPVALVLERERARIDGLPSPSEKSAALKKLLSARSALLDPDQKKALTADAAAPEPPARALSPKLQERHSLVGHNGEARGVAFSPDGRTLASVGYDATLRLWDLSTGQLRSTLKAGSPLWRTAFSPDGKTLATTELSGKVRLWDPVSGAERLAFSSSSLQTLGVAFTPDNLLVAACSTDATARLFEVATGRERAIFKDHPLGAVSVAISPDGKLVAVGSADHQIKIWETATSALRSTLAAHTKSVWSVAFSSDSRSLLSGSYDGTAKVWDVATGRDRLTLKVSTGEVPGALFSPDGRLVATIGKEGMLKLWDSSTGRELASVQAQSAYGRSIAFAPNGKALATSGWEPAVKVFDLSGIPPSKP